MQFYPFQYYGLSYAKTTLFYGHNFVKFVCSILMFNGVLFHSKFD
jgi:hypothetical protein